MSVSTPQLPIILSCNLEGFPYVYKTMDIYFSYYHLTPRTNALYMHVKHHERVLVLIFGDFFILHEKALKR